LSSNDSQEFSGDAALAMMVSARRGRCPMRRKQATRRPDESSATGSFKQKASGAGG